MIKLNIKRFKETIDIEFNVQSNQTIAESNKIISSMRDVRKELKLNMEAFDNLSNKGKISLTSLKTLFNRLRVTSNDLRNKIENAKSDNKVTSDYSSKANTVISNANLRRASIGYTDGRSRKYVQVLAEIKTLFKEIVNYSGLLTDESKKRIANEEKEADVLKKSTSKLEAFGRRLQTLAVRWRILSGVASQIIRTFTNMYESAAAYEESLNLYTVALGENAENATKWANRISEALYLDPSDVMQYTGALYNLVQGLGVASDDAYTMATNLTQLSYDMSSYLNINPEDAYAKIQSAITGQSRAVASAGIAMQQASLQELAYELGIKKTVSTMTQSEKTYLRYIQLLRSTTNMQGDLGRTIVTPANALRVIKTQFTLLSRAIGQVFIPIIMTAIPYIMVLTERLKQLANWLSVLTGYKVADVDYSGLTDVDLGYDDDISNINDGIKEIGSNADKTGKKLKNALAPFDELNVISSTSGSTGSVSSGGSASSGSGIIDKLKDYISGYDMLDGLTSTFNDNLDKARENLDKIVPIIHTIVAAIAGIKLIKGVLKAIQLLHSIETPLTTIGTSISKNLAKPLSGLITIIKQIGNNVTIFSEGSAFLKGLLRIGTLIGGIAGAIYGTKGAYDASKDATKSVLEYGIIAEESMNKTRNSIGLAIASGALAGSTFGALGIAIGAAAGGIISTTSALLAHNKAIKEYGESLVYGNVSISQEKWISMFEGSAKKITDYSNSLKQLNSSLDESYSSFDKNYKEIELYAMKLTTSAKQISEEEVPKIMSAIENVVTYSTNIITETTDYNYGLWLDTFEYLGNETDKSSKEMLDRIITYGAKQKDGIDEAQKNITNVLKDAINTRGYLTDEERKYIQTQLEKIRELTNASMSQNQTDMEYYKQKYMDTSLKLDKKSYEEYKKARESFSDDWKKETSETYNQLYNTAQQYWDKDSLQYQKAITEANNYRASREQELVDIIDGYDQVMVNNIASQYNDLKNKTGAVVDAQKEELRTIFYGIKPDSKNFIKEMENAGNEAGKTCATKLKNAFDANGGTSFSITVPVGANFTPFTSTWNKLVDDVNKQYSTNVSHLQSKQTVFTNTGGKCTFKVKKDGGFLDSGDFFFANENGMPEYITSIGNRSAVVNQQQMVTALTNAIIVGLSNMQNNNSIGNIEVNVGNEKLYSGTLKYIQRQNNIYGTNVINI